MSTRDGGPAFPRLEQDYIAGHGRFVRGSHGGMSLRDWFAGQASAAIIGGMISARISTSVDDAAEVAGSAYLIADAMLAAREVDA